MKFERLGNIVKISSGGTPKRNNPYFFEDGDILWVKTGDLKQKYIDDTPEKITINAVQNSSAKIFPAKTVLVAMYGATIGACSILKTEASTNQACAAILPTEKVNHEFLYYYFKSIQKQLISKGQGGGQPNISSQILKDTRIPIFSLPDQIRIATILSKTEKLIHKRKESITLLDEFLKSTFLAMFGDPVRNDKKWKIDLMANIIIDIKSGTSYSGEEKKELTENELGVLKISAVTGGYFNQNEFKAVAKDVIKKKIIPLKKGMFLVSRANTRELVAASCIVPQEYPSLFLPDKLWSLSVDKTKANDLFLNYLFKIESYRNIIREKASGGHESMLNISMAKFKKLKLPIPPLTLQDHFAQIVEKTNLIKSQYQTSLQELENLYGSLSQQAFKGELDLSKLEVLYEEEYSSRDNDRTDPDDFNKPINFENISVQIKKQKYYGGGEALISKPDKNEIASKTKEKSKSIWRITRITGKTSGIRFSDIEGNAILNDVFKKKRYGFTFQELELFLKKENFIYAYSDLQEFIFQQLEDNKLLQYYANEEWMRSNSKNANQDKDDFAGEGNIWFMVNNSNGKK